MNVQKCEFISIDELLEKCPHVDILSFLEYSYYDLFSEEKFENFDHNLLKLQTFIVFISDQLEAFGEDEDDFSDYEKDQVKSFIETLKSIHKLNPNLFVDLNYDNESKQIKELKPQIKKYKHDSSYPLLPKKPHGSLFDVGFIYDEDEDERILVAIKKLITSFTDILAVHEHEGVFTVYSKKPSVDIKEILVCNDLWTVFEYVPQNGKWIESL